MKKTIFVLILNIFLAFGIFCQSANSSGPIDMVVVLDTSSSMSRSYRETSNYLIGPFLLDNLRIGDTFHLISFSGTPKLEISRRIEGSGDIETIITRLLLMYPLYPESNISGALSYAESFASSLPSRSKKIVLISDGDAENTQNLVNDSSARFSRLGAELQYIKVPVTSNGSVRAPATSQNNQTAQTVQTTQPTQSGQAAQTTQPTQTTQSTQTASGGQSVQATQPAQTTQSGQTAQANQNVQSGQETQNTQAAQAVQTNETTQPSESAQQTQSSSPGASTQASGQATTQENNASGSSQTQAPVQGTSQAQPAQGSSGTSVSSSALNIPLPLILGLGLLLLLLLIGIIIFVSRRLDKSPNRVLAKAAAPGPSKPAPSAARTEQVTASRKPDQVSKPAQIRKTDQILEYPPPKMKPLPKDKVYDESTYGNGGPLLLNLFVEDQNTAIGKRNIHSLKPGYSFTIGGGKSDFLIFLVPVPPRIADVSYDGRNCAFIPRKPQYFPDIGSQTIPNCIGKTFRVISDKKYELHIRLERYEDPLQALNKLLRSIKVPGPVV